MPDNGRIDEQETVFGESKLESSYLLSLRSSRRKYRSMFLPPSSFDIIFLSFRIRSRKRARRRRRKKRNKNRNISSSIDVFVWPLRVSFLSLLHAQSNVLRFFNNAQGTRHSHLRCFLARCASRACTLRENKRASRSRGSFFLLLFNSSARQCAFFGKKRLSFR